LRSRALQGVLCGFEDARCGVVGGRAAPAVEKRRREPAVEKRRRKPAVEKSSASKVFRSICLKYLFRYGFEFN
jgi:hypothetical protein